jgi:hypothetical protein
VKQHTCTPEGQEVLRIGSLPASGQGLAYCDDLAIVERNLELGSIGVAGMCRANWSLPGGGSLIYGQKGSIFHSWRGDHVVRPGIVAG